MPFPECPVVRKINAYRRNELSEKKQEATAAHLTQCEECYNQLFLLDCIEDDGF